MQQNGNGTESADAMAVELPAGVAAKLERLRDIVRGYGSALVAYSGGVDSALVSLVAHQELGDRAMACIGVSPSFPHA